MPYSVKYLKDHLTVINQELYACWQLCRLHNNIGFWVVWIPTAWSIVMAYKSNSEVSLIDVTLHMLRYVPLCFGIKSFIMAIDDLLDHDIDSMVRRTQYRPIPRGAISITKASIFVGVQAVTGIYLATFVLPRRTMHISMCVWPLYIIYPTCKRWMSFAPVPLGIMFNVGIYMGWSDVLPHKDIPWTTLTLVYIGACFWTNTYESIYQHQDKIDDLKIGLHSPALYWGKKTVPMCLISACSFLCLLAYAATLNAHGFVFFCSLLFASARLINGLLRTDIDKPEDCQKFFMDTPVIGTIILAGFLLDTLVSRIQGGIPI
ncbi:Para-hydroxybenzoate--polyprenyltransferase, mitochondrial precursor (PHB:polyprenyltransferase) [Stygiomarasmius scandens]|uniref:Para-hydroxybenzoate--polyprenyltransferase, mitochondrial (PHB:polyprenyltransferase) n=1 Tax=Marasmiellus scandens TaxID=2682957 RepID=A0ABR1J0H6_9AGAR